MRVKSIRPVRVRWNNRVVDLVPGRPQDIPVHQAMKLMQRVPQLIRIAGLEDGSKLSNQYWSENWLKVAKGLVGLSPNDYRWRRIRRLLMELDAACRGLNRDRFESVWGVLDELRALPP